MIPHILKGNRRNVTGSIARPDEHTKTTWITPESIKPSLVSKRLCEAGPELCPECRMCAFGRFYLNMQKTERG